MLERSSITFPREHSHHPLSFYRRPCKNRLQKRSENAGHKAVHQMTKPRIKLTRIVSVRDAFWHEAPRGKQ